MKLPFTQKNVQDWGGMTTYRDGRALAIRGCVQEAEWDPETRTMRGVVAWGSHTIRTSGRVQPDGSLENRCPCRDCVDRGVVCTHIVALAYFLIARYTDPERQRKLLEEERQARHLKLVEEKAFIKRVPLGTPNAQDCHLRLVLPNDWALDAPHGNVPLEIHVEFALGAIRRLDGIPRDITLGMSPQDDSILFVLEEIAGGRVPGRMHLAPADFLNILGLHRGHRIRHAAGYDIPVQTEKVLTRMQVDLDHATGELVLRVHTPVPHATEQETPAYWVAGSRGFIFSGGAFWPLEKVLPEPLHEIYRNPIRVARPDVPRFLREDLPPLRQWLEVQTEVEPDVFDIEPETPQFRMVVRGSAASLSIQLTAVYGEVVLPCAAQCAAGSFAHPDPEDILHYTVRNRIAEQFALDALARHGIHGRNGTELSPVVGLREVLNFLGGTVPALRRRGWKVEWLGRIKSEINRMDYATPVVRIDGEVGSWFDVTVSHEDAKGRAIPPGEIQRALLKSDSFVEWNGRTVLLDAGAIRSLASVFSDCATGEGRRAGSFRLASVHAAYVAGALSALDGVDIEAPPEWLRRAAEQNRLTPTDNTPFAPAFEKILRPYQKTGVRWLRFLEKNHFAGILADEMGLGKTLQTLVWLSELAAQNKKLGKARPALIVCPTSLVENWIAESNTFSPDLKIGSMTGADRHSRWKDIGELDIAVTSYAILRRDIDLYEALDFSAAVLDEAQNIKNFSSQNALAAKRLKAEHRLVLTGTPIENGVFDIWSIMDFLMPSYLGSNAAFKANFAQPIAQGGPEGEMAQWKLRRKLRPFLLRRMKKDVAKELPPKIERLAQCALSPEQEKIYKALLQDSRQRIGEMVATKGFQHSRFEILRTLMRLRQACCHLDLLPAEPGAKPFAEPSSKMELFFELLDEARDAGHRVLVFSQFTSMLAIIRAEMDRRAIRYCYLDGATKNRMEIVHQFNATHEIPVFLISLKAGGTGLNLTGADMVIHYDPWWNPAVEDQATDRAYRIGQKRTVYSIKLITQNTVEERVLALQKRKQKLYKATLSTAEDTPDVTRELTWSDVQELLEL